jgi:hypothetical protein
VDWHPIAGSLRASLAGTRLFAFPLLVRVLNATEVSPSLAPQLLGGGNGYLVLSAASAEVFPERIAVRRLLSRLSGLPPESDQATWQRWLAGLP